MVYSKNISSAKFSDVLISELNNDGLNFHVKIKIANDTKYKQKESEYAFINKTNVHLMYVCNGKKNNE